MQREPSFKERLAGSLGKMFVLLMVGGLIVAVMAAILGFIGSLAASRSLRATVPCHSFKFGDGLWGKRIQELRTKSGFEVGRPRI